MKKSLKSLGSISALSALCALPTANAAVMVSPSISNTALSVGSSDQAFSVNFDINNDAQTDFTISTTSNEASLILGSVNGSAFFIVGGIAQAKGFNIGDSLDFNSPGAGTAMSTGSVFLHDTSDTGNSLIVNGTSYFGVAFNDGSGDIKNAWVQLDVVLDSGIYNQSGDSITVVTSQWESLDNTAITIVPEPSALLLSLAGMCSFGFVRRRK